MTTSEKRMAQNPFSDDYWKAELKAYGLRKSKFYVEHVSVDWFTIQGRCDDYLNVNMRFDETPLPRLGINGHLWMSLTPMEIQSAALAIHRAKGVVVTGGLGLGYFALRAAAKPEVSEVIVFEKEPIIVEWFQRRFKPRPEMAKIKIVTGDVRELFQGFAVDFVFMDIYDSLLPNAVLKDCRLFRKQNQLKRYHYWGYEKVVLELLQNKMLKYGALMLGSDIQSYFRHWITTPFTPGKEADGTLPNYSRIELREDFLKSARQVIVDFPL